MTTVAVRLCNSFLDSQQRGFQDEQENDIRPGRDGDSSHRRFGHCCRHRNAILILADIWRVADQHLYNRAEFSDFLLCDVPSPRYAGRWGMLVKKLDQFYRLHQILDARKTPVSVSQLAARLECSDKTVRRYLEEFEDLWDAPLIHVDRQGWMYDRSRQGKWEVPGLWMTPEESQSLLLLLDILSRFGNGVLNDELESVRRSVDRALDKRHISRTELEARIRIIPIGQRFVPDHRLQQVLNAFVRGCRLYIHYRDFSLTSSKRTISPQRLVYYRDNWYMDAMCHSTDALKTFSLARVERSRLIDDAAQLIPQETLDQEFMGSYGVFAGEPVDTATLRFLPEIAGEISRQAWHPDQQSEWDGDDYLLSIPYADPRELILDIMRYLPGVIVEEPASLRDAVMDRVRTAMNLHDTG